MRATFDARQVGEDRLSSVQYLKFDVRRASARWRSAPTIPGSVEEVALTPEQRQALEADLAA